MEYIEHDASNQAACQNKGLHSQNNVVQEDDVLRKQYFTSTILLSGTEDAPIRASRCTQAEFVNAYPPVNHLFVRPLFLPLLPLPSASLNHILLVKMSHLSTPTTLFFLLLCAPYLSFAHAPYHQTRGTPPSPLWRRASSSSNSRSVPAAGFYDPRNDGGEMLTVSFTLLSTYDH